MKKYLKQYFVNIEHFDHYGILLVFIQLPKHQMDLNMNN